MEPFQPAARASGPASAPYFTGREAEVARLVDRLRRARRGDRISLTGPGGIGKTAIAREAMALAAQAFSGGVHSHDFYVSPSLAAFEHSLLGSFGEEPDPEIRAEIIHNLLSAEPALVYAEGVEKLRDHPAAATLPQLFAVCSNAVLLITWREPLDPVSTEVWNIDVLGVDEAARLIHAHVTGGDAQSEPSQAARDLATLLGCHPLALTVAGSLWRHTQAGLSECVDSLRSAGLESLGFRERPDAALHAIFHMQAAALPAPARLAWYALSLHDFCLTRLRTLATCLALTESETLHLLELLVARGIAEPGILPRQSCHAEATAWRLSHPRLAEWGRSSLHDSEEGSASLIHRWRSLWETLCHDGWKRCLVGGNRAWKAFHAAHLRAFLKSLQRLDGATPELVVQTDRCAQFCIAFGLLTEALEFAHAAVDISRRLHGPNALETIGCQMTHAHAMIDTTRGLAVDIMEGLLPHILQSAGPAHPLALRARGVLACLLFERHEHAQDTRAIGLLQENLMASTGSDPEALELQFFSQETLSHHLVSTDHPDAKSSVLDLLRWTETHEGFDTLCHPNWYAWAAWLHGEDEEFTDALACLRRADSGLQRIPLAEPEILAIRSQIIDCLCHQERWDEAVAEAEDFIAFAHTLTADSASYVSAGEDHRNAARERRLLTHPEADSEEEL